MNEELEKKRSALIDRILGARNERGFWKTLKPGDKYYPDFLHYVPNFKASLWALILLADLKYRDEDQSLKPVLTALLRHFYREETGAFDMGGSHSPYPCLNGNLIYLDSWFNGSLGARSRKALDFFAEIQRFDDGEYSGEKNIWCRNKHCYGKHSCYWGVVKLMKGISFIPKETRTERDEELMQKCIDFVLRHRVIFSSHKPDKIMINKIDLLTFPAMYKGDMLEILWILAREEVRSNALKPALALLESKQNPQGTWNLERQITHLVSSVGVPGRPNGFVTQRAREIMDFFILPSHHLRKKQV